jgi:hypothetical protein
MRRVMRWGAVVLGLAAWASPGAAEEMLGRPRPWGAPLIVPEFDVPLPMTQPPQYRIQNPDALVAELGDCRNGGQLDLTMCLWGGMSSVDVRRMEACLGSNIIPDDPAPARACYASLPR